MIDHAKIVAMAVAAIAEETNTDISRIRVVSFKEAYGDCLEKYIKENDIQYKKYQLGD